MLFCSRAECSVINLGCTTTTTVFVNSAGKIFLILFVKFYSSRFPWLTLYAMSVTSAATMRTFRPA